METTTQALADLMSGCGIKIVMETSPEEFAGAVLALLPEIPDEYDRDVTRRCAEELCVEGFNISEARSFCWYLEHVSPDIDEDKALAGMRRVILRVEERLGRKLPRHNK